MQMKKHVEFFLLTLLWPMSFAIRWGTDSPYVRTHLGGIKGYYKTSEDGRQYAAFQSVPYAQPPVGALRFEPPVPVKPWFKDIEALKLPPACAQFNSELKIATGKEDCLYLNIYIPLTKKLSLPVIFWIHGGGFQYGRSCNAGPKYLMDRDVILVTINYRLGPLGFLSTGDELVPGNMGLKDQVLALKWILNNVKYFGGNPKKITLMGVSAGAASVHYHYLSPQSRGLFRNGVSFSGSALTPWSFTENGTDISKTFAKSLTCPVDNTFRMIQCLKGISIDSILNATSRLLEGLYFPIAPFVPVVEKKTKNYFINDSPRNILIEGKANDVPWITGIVKDEGLFMTAGFILNKTLMEYTDKNWEKIGPRLLCVDKTFPPDQQVLIANKARKHYFGDNRPFSNTLASAKKLTSLVGDEVIVIGCIEAARLQSKVNKSPTRFYYYTFRAAQSTSDDQSYSTVNLGVSHIDDVYLVLKNKHINPTTTEKDKDMLQVMLNYWYTIANNKSPDVGTPWPPLNPNSPHFQYMHIAGPKNFTMETMNDNFGEIRFWNEILQGNCQRQ